MPEIKWSWQHAIIKSDLKSTTKLVLHTLNCHMSPVGDSCFPSISTIANEASLSRRSVITHLETAEKEGWIQREKHQNGKTWARNSYLPRFPDEINKKTPEYEDQFNNPDAGYTSGVVNLVHQGSERAAPGVVKEVHSNRSVLIDQLIDHKDKTLMSGKAPDDASKEFKKQKNGTMSLEELSHSMEILKFLNEKTGRRYQPVPANLKLIYARIKEVEKLGDDYSRLRQVIAMKTREWTGTDMEQYLRPATLFNATKFSQYYGELHWGASNGCIGA